MPSFAPYFPLVIDNTLNPVFQIFPISDFNVDIFTYEALLGYRFNLPEEASFNAYYHNINKPGQIILAEHTWWSQSLVPYSSTYSIFDDLKVPLRSTERRAGVDSLSFARFEAKNTLNDEPQSLPTIQSVNMLSFDYQNTSISSTPSAIENSSVYWMILPKIVDNPFVNFKQNSQFNLSNPKNFYNAIANEKYTPNKIEGTEAFNGYSLHYLLNTTVRCISECSSEFTKTLTNQDIPEGSHILALIMLGVICCARIIKRSTP